MARKHCPALNPGLRGHISGLHSLLVLYSPAPGLWNILAHNRSLRAICSCQWIFGRGVPSSVLVALCLPALCSCLPSCRTPWAVGILWDSFQVPNLCPPFLATPFSSAFSGWRAKQTPPSRKKSCIVLPQTPEPPIALPYRLLRRTAECVRVCVHMGLHVHMCMQTYDGVAEPSTRRAGLRSCLCSGICSWQVSGP